MELKINGCTLLLTTSVQSQLDYLFNIYLVNYLKIYFIHTFTNHAYLILY